VTFATAKRMTFHWLCCSAETERTLAMLDDLQTQRDEEDAAHIKKVVARADSWKEGQELWEAAKAKVIQASSIKQITL
jgi:hypothetical protein